MQNLKSRYYEEALALADLDCSDGETILGLLRNAHEEGDPRGTYAIASCYVDGKYGSEVDEKIAHRLFKSISKYDLPEAIFALAYSYDVGDVCRRNRKSAFSLYMRAALLGHREACWQVSEFYREGLTVEHDGRLAKAWRRRAKCEEEDISPPYRIWLR